MLAPAVSSVKNDAPWSPHWPLNRSPGSRCTVVTPVWVEGGLTGTRGLMAALRFNYINLFKAEMRRADATQSCFVVAGWKILKFSKKYHF